MMFLRLISGIQTLKEGDGVKQVVKMGEGAVVMGWWKEKDFHCQNCDSVFRLTSTDDDKKEVSVKIYKGEPESSICPEHGSHEHFLGNPKCAHYTTKCPVCNLNVEISKVFEKNPATH